MNKLFRQFIYFNKSQRYGVIGLFGLIIIAQLVIFSVNFAGNPVVENADEKQQWLSLQNEIDLSLQEATARKLFGLFPD